MILGLLFTGGLWCCLGGFVGLLPEADAVGAGGREGSLLLAEPPPSAPPPLPDGNKRLVCVVALEDTTVTICRECQDTCPRSSGQPN